MIRLFAGLAVSWCALQLAELSKWLLPKRPEAPRRQTPAPLASKPPPPATRVPERYVRELVRLDLVQADALLCFVLGSCPVFWSGSGIAKVPDTRWRQ